MSVLAVAKSCRMLSCACFVWASIPRGSLPSGVAPDLAVVKTRFPYLTAFEKNLAAASKTLFV
jgi:hypothetical protein